MWGWRKKHKPEASASKPVDPFHKGVGGMIDRVKNGETEKELRAAIKDHLSLKLMFIEDAMREEQQFCGDNEAFTQAAVDKARAALQGIDHLPISALPFRQEPFAHQDLQDINTMLGDFARRVLTYSGMKVPDEFLSLERTLDQSLMPNAAKISMLWSAIDAYEHTFGANRPSRGG